MSASSLSILENMSASAAANAVGFSFSEYTGTDLNLNRTKGAERNIRILAPANTLLYYKIVDLRGNVNSTDLNDKGFNTLEYGRTELDEQEFGNRYLTYDWENGFGTIFTGSDPTHPYKSVSFWFDTEKNSMSPNIQQFKIEIYGDDNLSILLETLPTVTLYRTESDLLSLSSNDNIGNGPTETTLIDPSDSQDLAVGRLYTAAFGRVPDEGGLQYWINVVNDPLVSYKDVSQNFVDSPEFSTIALPNASSDVFATALYKNVLGRAPDAPGLSHWTNQLNSGLQDRADVLMGFANSAENVALYETLV